VKEIRGRWTTLRLPDRGDYDSIYEIALSAESAWMWRGRVRGPETFVDSLWTGILSNLVVVSNDTQQVVGLLQAYSHNPLHQVCYMNVFLHDSVQGAGWPLEGLGMFLNFLFKHYNLRKVYAEMTESSLSRLGSNFGNWATIEGRLKEHVFVDGVFVDVTIVAIYRAAFVPPVDATPS
jgi:RimJ/RimL family protein N-acetyltransferase